MEDDKVALLENQLAQAKLIAEEADKKYEEVQLYIFLFLEFSLNARALGLLGLLSFSLLFLFRTLVSNSTLL